MMDPWVITPQERERHAQQFNSVNPEAGFITGAQAKGYFMQSGLPPMVLAQIWGLADMNGDGKMDLNEFSVACKLINLKLKGMELPKTLPPQIFGGPPNQLPLSAPHRPMQPGMQGMAMGMGMGMPGMMQQPRMPGMMPGMGMHGGMPGMAGGMPGMGGGMPGMMPNTSMATSMPGMMPNNSMMGMTMPGAMGGMAGGMGAMNMGGVNTMPGMMGGQGMMGMQQPAIPGVQPSVMPASTGMAAVPQQPAAAAPAAPPPTQVPAPAAIEWAIPQQKRVGYTAQFQTNDKARTGFLAAVQARNLLLQTGLAQQTLATVWNLADIDKDGKLNCEEFILAMHLCDMGMKGEPLPTPLPITLIPPSMRKHMASGVSTPGSVKSGNAEEVMSPASFEDKRRENWESGQAELQKRRASLLEQQKRDEEARKKKEKEEAEQRERQKQEAERRRQAEIERQRQRQLQEEEQRRRAEEQRELARKEMEKQRMEEWEKQRRNELEQHRQREQERVLQLRAQKNTLSTDLENLKTKMTDLSNSIVETRTGVTDVKTFIDGMRTSRDTKMAELNALKNQLKEQNQRLMQVTQEKSKLESKNKVSQQRMEGGTVVEITDFDLKKEEKKNQVEVLRTQLETLKDEEKIKKEQVENNKTMLMEHRERLKMMIETCKALHEGFDEKRREVRAEKQKKIRELTDPNHAWGGGFDDVPVVAEPEPVPPAVQSPDFSAPEPMAAVATAEPVADAAPAAGYLQYRALYDYEARNEDELSFNVNDIIMVHPDQEHEPGWLGGELNGKIGWFPETYAERVGGETMADHTLQPIAEVSETGSDNGSFQEQNNGLQETPAAAADASAVEAVEPTVATEPAVTEAVAVESQQSVVAYDLAEYEQYISLYPYQSEEPDDLQFEAGERILVSRKDGDWWTGSIGDRTGVFPYNYVEPAPAEGADQPVLTTQPSVVENDVSINEADKSKKMEIAKVLAPYAATSKEQLSLQQGQMILVRKKTDSGWWQGELQAGGKGKKRAVGWFPASYVQLLDSGAGKKTAESTSSGEPFVAAYDYNSQYEDELTFKAGDTIMVISKDDADWWKGTLGDKTGVFPSNYVEPAAKLTPPATARENLFNEIFNTEQRYLDHLNLVYEVFVKPIRASNILSKQDLSTIFINWKDLIITSTKLIKSLKIRKSFGSQFQIGDILCENFPTMTAYIRYCSSQQNSGIHLQNLVETNTNFYTLLKQCQSNPKTEGMMLSYFLLKPVKRVTEYPLLVEKLLKNTATDHPDYHYTCEALERAKALCEQVNEGMRERENSERLEWLQIHVDLQSEEKVIQEKITFNSLTNSVGPRRFLHCGVLRKTKSDKQLIGFLFNDFLLLTTGNKSLGGSQFSFTKHKDFNLKLYRQPMFLSGLEIGESIRKQSVSSTVDVEPSSGFSLKYGEVSLSLEGLSPNDRTLWFNTITDAINRFKTVESEFVDKQKSAKSTEMKEAKGRLLLILVKAENLRRPNPGGNINSYCEATIGYQEQKSPVISGTNPHWNVSMQFMLRDISQEILCLTVYDRDYFSPNEFLGRTEVKISDVVEECRAKMGPVTKSLKLLEAESGLLTIKLDVQLFD